MDIHVMYGGISSEGDHVCWFLAFFSQLTGYSCNVWWNIHIKILQKIFFVQTDKQKEERQRF